MQRPSPGKQFPSSQPRDTSPLRNGTTHNHQPAKPDVRKWPSCFQALGYQVVAIGKVSHYAQVTTYGFDHAGFYNYHHDECVEEAVEWLAACKSEKPLRLFVGTNWPHVPWPVKSKILPDSLTMPRELADTPEIPSRQPRKSTDTRSSRS